MINIRQYKIEFRTYPLWLKVLLPLSGTVLITSLITQMILFPDNPIFLRNGGYVGKYGATHTREEYEMFTWINRTILLSGLTFFGAFFSTMFYASSSSEKDLGRDTK